MSEMLQLYEQRETNQNLDPEPSMKRKKNNEAVKKSREKSRNQTQLTVQKITELKKENSELEERNRKLQEKIKKIKTIFLNKTDQIPTELIELPSDEDDDDDDEDL